MLETYKNYNVQLCLIILLTLPLSNVQKMFIFPGVVSESENCPVSVSSRLHEMKKKHQLLTSTFLDCCPRVSCGSHNHCCCFSCPVNSHNKATETICVNVGKHPGHQVTDEKMQLPHSYKWLYFFAFGDQLQVSVVISWLPRV